jgi:hypothetical protein
VSGRKILDDNDGVPIVGLFFVHQLKVFRVLVACAIGTAVALGIAIWLAKDVDASTGFTAGAFVLGIVASFLALLSIILALSRS